MPFGKASSRTPEAAERRAEGRLLNALKGALREVVATFQDREKLTQSQAADKLGCDAGFLSRTLNPDFHVNSRTLAQIMHRAGGEWVISWRSSTAGSQHQDCFPNSFIEVASVGVSLDPIQSFGKPRHSVATNGLISEMRDVKFSGSKPNKTTVRLLAA